MGITEAENHPSSRKHQVNKDINMWTSSDWQLLNSHLKTTFRRNYRTSAICNSKESIDSLVIVIMVIIVVVIRRNQQAPFHTTATTHY